jgi:hypothetical protein
MVNKMNTSKYKIVKNEKSNNWNDGAPRIYYSIYLQEDKDENEYIFMITEVFDKENDIPLIKYFVNYCLTDFGKEAHGGRCSRIEEVDSVEEIVDYFIELYETNFIK